MAVSDPKGDPWNSGTWVELPLRPKEVELMVHFGMKPDASHDERIRDLWPHNDAVEGAALLSLARENINTTASELSGRPGDVIKSSLSDTSVEAPVIRVRVLGTPVVEVCIG